MNFIQKVTTQVLSIGNAASFSLIGDPGCEGLGTMMMRVFVNALKLASRDDFILIAGDMVPTGKKRFYEAISEITDSVVEKDTYVLRGNHDTGVYTDYFGLQNYALVGEAFTVVVLDNAMRAFEEEGLELLDRVLAMEESRNVVIAFHIPLPNHFIRNSVSEAEFERLKAVYEPYRDKVKYFACGHVHSRFEDVVDGIPLICSGGGGAMIEDVSEEIKASEVDYHIVRFFMEEGVLRHRIVDLTEMYYKREQQEPVLKEKLEEAVKGELYAHLKYLTFADRAEKRGYDKVANLMRALADSEYRHARSFFAILEQPVPFMEALHGFIKSENFEYERLYPMVADYASEIGGMLAKQAFSDAGRMERYHARLIGEAKNLDEFAVETLYVCPVCGCVMTEVDELDRCPVCGAPKRQFKEFESKKQG